MTGAIVKEYLNIVGQEEDFPDTWQRAMTHHNVYKIDGLYEAVCDLEKVAAQTLIGAARAGALKPRALANLLYSLSQPLESVPYSFQECCLRHVHQEREFLALNDPKNMLFIRGRSVSNNRDKCGLAWVLCNLSRL
jgi:hypothetical protein